MRKLPICSDIDVVDMTTQNQNLEVAGESRIEKMRKLLTSPLTRRKSHVCQSRIFGVALDALVQKAPGEMAVPFIVTRICQYIEKNGLTHEGIFRTSGNARVIDRLRTAFDQSGDAPLETEGDIPSAAGLLKLFLRELPEPLIPVSMHTAFLDAVRGSSNEEACIQQLRYLSEKLPQDSLCILRFICHFLHRVAQHEEQNRMGACALGIVFGPNLFRVSGDFSGLKDQAVTNQVVSCLISNYHEIFDGDTDVFSDLQHLEEVSRASCENNIVQQQKLQSSPLSCAHLIPVCLQPLTVEIPPLQEVLHSLPSQVQSQEAAERQIPILMVDSYLDKSIHNSVVELMSNEEICAKDEGHVPSCRKRKERKVSGDEQQAPRSSSEERPSFCQNGTLSLSVNEQIRRCNSSEEVSVTATSDSSCENYIEETQNELVLEQVGSLKPTQALNNPDTEMQDVADLSPHPPKPKRREIEHSQEPMLDPQARWMAQPDVVDFHEVQRSAERVAPIHRGTQVKSHRSGSRASKKDAAKKELPELSKPDSTSQIPVIPEPLEPNYMHCTSPTSSRENLNVDFRSPDGFAEHRSNASVDDEITSSGPLHEFQYNGFHSVHREEGQLSYPLLEVHPVPDSWAVERDNQDDRELEREMASASSLDSVRENIPPLDLNSLHEHGDGCEPIPSEHRLSWPMLKTSHDETLLSPRPYLRKASSYEAPLSPSAFKSYLSHRGVHLDPNLPPSPPVEQDSFGKRYNTMKEDEATSATIKQLNKKMQSLKKKIKQFEERFENDHGYRPSHADKAHYPEVKVLMVELSKIRKEIKALKEETHSDDGHWMATSKDDINAQDRSLKLLSKPEENISIVTEMRQKPVIEDTVNDAVRCLTEKRRLAQRPEAMEEMTKEQVTEEKLSIQKLLLHIESIHGRPSTRSDRDLVRPLYERYRNVKRLIARSNSVGLIASKAKDGMELQPILEHVTMHFTSSQKRDTYEGMTEELEETVASSIKEDDVHPAMENDVELNSDNPDITQPCQHSSYHRNLHELPLPELLNEQQQARVEKRKLRATLKEFEDNFQKQSGRKVQKEDKAPVESVYSDYKHIKARLRLLEALISKHVHRKMV